MMNWNVVWHTVIITAFILGITEIGEPDKVIMTMVFAGFMHLFHNAKFK